MLKSILPSLLSFKSEEWIKCIDISCKFGINEFHFDVMEYEYVKNTSFDLGDFQYFLTIRNDISANVHLMVIDPWKWIDNFISVQTDTIFFHYEVMKSNLDTIDLIKYIKSKNIKAGIVINPNNNFDEYFELLHYIDAILIMGVYPGFGGQPFIYDTINNLEKVYNYKIIHNLKYYIEFDGGLNKENIEKIYKYTDKFVVGNYYYKNLDKIKEFVDWFKKL